MRFIMLVASCLLGGTMAADAAASCPGNPDAIGTSRTIAVDPATLPRIGTMQYSHSLPLEDHEVVITFDDGPLPPYTDRILETLAANCVKATYFLVGQMANAYPDAVRRIYNAGHAVGTHSMNHPFHFDALGQPRLEREVGDGIASVKAALGDPRALAPFFRIPGLARSHAVEEYLASQSLAVWSADQDADDWFRHVTAEQIVRKAMRRIAAKGHRGVLLLHDIHPATATALPMLLKELKDGGYKIVQAVPTGERPASVPEPPPAKPTQVADATPGGSPGLIKTKTDGEKPTHVAHRKHHKRLARHHRDDDEVRPSRRHRHHIAHSDSDAEVVGSIVKKKRKSRTAERQNHSSVQR